MRVGTVSVFLTTLYRGPSSDPATWQSAITMYLVVNDKLTEEIPGEQEWLVSKWSRVLRGWLSWEKPQRKEECPRVGFLHRFLYTLKHLELWNAGARTWLSKASFDRAETLNIGRGAGYEYAWAHGHTGSIFRAIFRNILEKTDTNKQNTTTPTIRLKFDIQAQLLIPKWLKMGECVLGGGGEAGVLSQWPPQETPPPTHNMDRAPPPHVHRVPWGLGAEEACGACRCGAEMLTGLIATVTTVTFQNLPRWGWGRGSPKSQI